MATQLDLELDLFKAALPGLLGDPAVRGRFVVVARGEPMLVSYPTFDDALRAGYERFGLDRPLLVRQVTDRTDPQYFSRNLTPCH